MCSYLFHIWNWFASFLWIQVTQKSNSACALLICDMAVLGPVVQFYFSNIFLHKASYPSSVSVASIDLASKASYT